MLSAIQTSLSGLLSASNRAKIAAENVVRAGAQGVNEAANTLEAGTLASGKRAYGAAVVLGSDAQAFNGQASYGAQTASGGRGPDGPAPDLARSIVDLKLAAQAYKANAVALRTADETLGALLEDKS